MVFWPEENGWFSPKHCISQAWWHMPVISMFRVEARGEKFKVTLSYIPNLIPAWHETVSQKTTDKTTSRNHWHKLKKMYNEKTEINV